MSEPYATPVGNTVQRFASFHEAADGASSVTLEVTLDVASDVVESLAPRPVAELDADGNWPADYVRRAGNAELLIARWIFDTEGGDISSEGLEGISTSYSNNPAVRSIVDSAMGSYASSKQDDDDATVYIGTRADFF